MRVLMLGWEFPPFISGGLGTACHGLTAAMNRMRMNVLFVLPRAFGAAAGSGTTSTSRRETRGRTTIRPVLSGITNPYQRPREASEAARPAPASAPHAAPALVQAGESLCVLGAGAEGGYEGDLLHKIEDYARRCEEVARDEPFDVVHAHDWMTFPAGMAIATRRGCPLVVHVHATEFDRSGEHVHQPVYDIERRGMHAATAVIAVSHYTKRIIVERYGVPTEKVRVVHNGVETARGNGRSGATDAHSSRPADADKVVLFLGRITRQKGPEYFVSAAARVLERFDKVRFIVAGSGDLAPSIIERVAAMHLGHKVFFAGFLRGPDVERAYRMADAYIMPSVSEPFGLTALEAVHYGVPTIISRSSGVAEVLPEGALHVDFWDVDKMADMIVSLLRRPALADELRRKAAAELKGLSWDAAAEKCRVVYGDACGSSPSSNGAIERAGCRGAPSTV